MKKHNGGAFSFDILYNDFEVPMKKHSIITLLAIEFIIIFEMSVVMPLSPVIARVYQIPVTYVTWLNVGYTLAGIVAPKLGGFADRYSIKKIMMVALMSFVVGSLGIAFTTSAVAYFIFRFLIGIGYYTLISLIISYASRIISAEQYNRFNGAVKVAFALGVLVAPVLCSWIEANFSYQAIYLMLGVSAAILCGMLAIMEDAKNDKHLQKHKLLSLFKDRNIVRMIVVTVLMSTPSVYVYTFTALSLSAQGHDQFSISLLYTIIGLGSLLAGLVIMALGKKLPLLKGLYIGILFVLITLPFFPMNTKLLFGVSILFGFGYDMFWGGFYPFCAKLKPLVSGSFLTLLSLGMAFSNMLHQMIGPFIYEQAGYLGGIIFTIVCILAATILLNKGANSA